MAPVNGTVVDYDEGDDTKSPSVVLKTDDDGRQALLVCSLAPGVSPRVENGVPEDENGGGHTWQHAA